MTIGADLPRRPALPIGLPCGWRSEWFCAFVTGGASGLGRAACLALARAEVHVVAADINAAGLDTTVETITSSGGSAEARTFDVTGGQHRVEAMADLFGRFGEVVRHPGECGRHRPSRFYLVDVDEAAYSQVFAVNCHGPVFLMKAFLNGFLGLARRGGRRRSSTSSPSPR